MTNNDTLRDLDLKTNGKATVTYSYTREYGSDGCWDETVTSICTVRQWLNGVEKLHPGNRSYGFQLVKVEG